MIRRLKMALAAALFLPSVLLSGCSLSLHPLYTSKDVVFEAALLGEWTDKTQDVWSVTQAGQDHYRVVYTDSDHKRGEFVAHLVRVQGATFLDLFPAETQFSQSDLYASHFLPVHSVYKVVGTHPMPQLAELSEDWLRAYLARHPAALRHETVNNWIYLTASPREIQRFLIAHLTAKGAFEPGDIWQRKQ